VVRWFALLVVWLCADEALAKPARSKHTRRRHHTRTVAPVPAEKIVPRDATPAAAQTTPRDATPAAAQTTPRDATPAAGRTTPRDATPAAATTPRAVTKTTDARREVPSVAASPEPTPPPSAFERASQLPAVDVAVGGRGYYRDLGFSDDVYDRYGHVRAPLNAALEASVEYYPGRHVTPGPGAWFGLVASGAYGLGMRAQDDDGNPITSGYFEVDGGLKMRWPIADRLTLGIAARFSYERYTLGAVVDRNGVDTVDLSVAYMVVRADASLRYDAAAHFALLARAEAGPVLNAGQLQSLFPQMSGAVFHASLGVAIPVVAGFELRVLADYRRYFFAFNPRVDDINIAGGALDQYLRASLSLAFRR
jgi:hypothetical protein